jgi:hypothetical protein
VRFLRLLANALLIGLLFSYLLALLIVDLNINLAFRAGLLLRLTLALMPCYGLIAAVAAFVLTAAYRFLSGRAAALPFVSPSFLALGIPITTLAFLVIFRENYVHFYSFFAPRMQSLLRTQMMILFVLSVAGLIVHFRHHYRKPSRGSLIAFCALSVFVLALGIVQRLRFPSAPRSYRLNTIEAKDVTRKVTLLCFDGLNQDVLLRLTSERKLPNFIWLMEKGGWGRLRSFTPSDPFVLRRSVDTGKWPSRHRQLSEVRYRLPLVDADLEAVPRFILFRQLKRIGYLRILPNDSPPAAKDIWRIAADAGVSTARYGRSTPPAAPAATDPKLEKLFAGFFPDHANETSWIFDQVRQAFFRDAAAEEEALKARMDNPAQIFALTLDGAQTAETYFHKYSNPEDFGEIAREEIQRYGSVIEKVYGFYDQVISRTLAALKDEELLIVYSSYGMEPLPFWKRVVEWMLGNSAVTAYHERGPDGVIFFYGKGIEQGKPVEGFRLVDIVPTALYYLGLPVGRDMDGLVRGSLFTPEFADLNPVFQISSYEDVAVKKRISE